MVTKIVKHSRKIFQAVMYSPVVFQVVCLSFFILFVFSFSPITILWKTRTFEVFRFGSDADLLEIKETGFLDSSDKINLAGVRESYTKDENGNIIVNVISTTRTKVLKYIVKQGDSISKIAHKFNIKESTLLWANEITAKKGLLMGQELLIPPIDGVFYKVKNGDTLSVIAEAHNVGLEKILVYNKISKDKYLSLGQELFIPNATKSYVPNMSKGSSGYSSTVVAKKSGIGKIGFKIKKPTEGVLSQGYHSKHFAIDISNRLNTPIYSAASGVVVKVGSGWNFGYGKYLVIDHGNGVQTLYAHCNEIKVKKGDKVSTGQLIALMGNTGNVLGPTGIHLHFELHINGRKVNPFNYF